MFQMRSALYGVHILGEEQVTKIENIVNAP
jgi:hypothetical protein